MHPSLAQLPDHLAERARVFDGRGAPAGGASGGHVIYWMRLAARGHDNPALDVALTLADALDRPLFVVHELNQREAYACDRFHRFALEGARDVETELRQDGIAYGLHVERPGHDASVLEELARRAAVIVTEDLPTPSMREATRALADVSPAPVVAVDTSCVLPMRLVKKRPERAFRFRDETQAIRLARLDLPWPPFAGRILSAAPEALPFTPVDPATAELDALIAQCDIDHMVGPIFDTPGGSAAGYARWRAFRDDRLHAYAQERNDALARDAVSRMSAYLHFGHVSPFAIARDALFMGGKGADKFLDEFLVWRELAHVWCFHTAEIETLAALPGWARSTLDATRSDPRPARFDWETLARARTGDSLWDAAQTSLLVHGELHNNLRMTWGKALQSWTAEPEEALERLIDLNHRYALDGRDPNSYGGLLWCLGLFDRPFEPPSPVTGALRCRSTASHAQRLDLDAYSARVRRANSPEPPKIAVIGAGMAGLICARTLLDHRFKVTVFEKSRGLGGRMATRRTDAADFDHGAQYFTARDPRFVRYVEAWQTRGLVDVWTPRGRDEGSAHDPWWVPQPGMSALGRHLGTDLEARLETTVARLVADDGGWRVMDAAGTDHGRFDIAVVATPPPQAVPLLAPAPALADAAARADMAPCWAALIAFERPLDIADVSRHDDGVLSWIARNGGKPGRDGGDSWVLHATPTWSMAHLEREPEAVLADLIDALEHHMGCPLPPMRYAKAHRWRYALAHRPVGVPSLFDATLGLGACGDWCLGGRVEAAFLSGAAAAGRILNAAVTRGRRAR